MKKSKFQQYFHCFVFGILIPCAFWFSYWQNIVKIPISAAFRGEALISMWIPKGAVLIRGRHLFEALRLLEEIRYFDKYQTTTWNFNHYIENKKTITKIPSSYDFTEFISKQAIKLTHILKVNFEWKFETVSAKSVLCILKIYNYKLPVFRTNFLKLKFWKFLSNF